MLYLGAKVKYPQASSFYLQNTNILFNNSICIVFSIRTLKKQGVQKP